MVLVALELNRGYSTARRVITIPTRNNLKLGLLVVVVVVVVVVEVRVIVEPQKGREGEDAVVVVQLRSNLFSPYLLPTGSSRIRRR